MNFLTLKYHADVQRQIRQIVGSHGILRNGEIILEIRFENIVWENPGTTEKESIILIQLVLNGEELYADTYSLYSKNTLRLSYDSVPSTNWLLVHELLIDRFGEPMDSDEKITLYPHKMRPIEVQLYASKLFQMASENHQIEEIIMRASNQIFHAREFSQDTQ